MMIKVIWRGAWVFGSSNFRFSSFWPGVLILTDSSSDFPWSLAGILTTFIDQNHDSWLRDWKSKIPTLPKTNAPFQMRRSSCKRSVLHRCLLRARHFLHWSKPSWIDWKSWIFLFPMLLRKNSEIIWVTELEKSYVKPAGTPNFETFSCNEGFCVI